MVEYPERHYWIDDWGKQGAACLELPYEQLIGADSAPVYLLLDAGFVPGIASRLDHLPEVYCRNLFAGTYSGDALDTISPVLLQIPENTDSRLVLWQQLCRYCSGCPMLTLIQSPLPSAVLAQTLLRRMEAKAQGSQEAYFLRIADTRCFPMLWQVLDEAQKAWMMEGISRWMWLGRAGVFSVIESNAIMQNGLAIEEALIITEVQHKKLNVLALPDALLFRIRSHPEWVGELSGLPSQQYLICEEAMAATVSDGYATDSKLFRVMIEALVEAGLLYSSIRV